MPVSTSARIDLALDILQYMLAERDAGRLTITREELGEVFGVGYRTLRKALEALSRAGFIIAARHHFGVRAQEPGYRLAPRVETVKLKSILKAIDPTLVPERQFNAEELLSTRLYRETFVKIYSQTLGASVRSESDANPDPGHGLPETLQPLESLHRSAWGNGTICNSCRSRISGEGEPRNRFNPQCTKT